MPIVKTTASRFLQKYGMAFLVKLPLTLLLLWVLYKQLVLERQWETLLSEITVRWQWPHLWLLLLVVIMLVMNLGLETWKFRLLTKQFLPTGFSVLFKSVLGGMAVAMVTPNRVGEYAGRVLFLKSKYGWQAVAATIVGSLSQLLAIIGFGLLGTLAFNAEWLERNGISEALLLFFGIGLVAVLFVIYYNIDLVVPLLKRVPLGNTYQKILSKLSFQKHYSMGQLSLIFLVATGRYLTYCTQYVLLLWFFGMTEEYLHSMAIVAMVFLVQTSIPLPPLASLVARGEFALLAFGNQEAKVLVPVMSATFLLFFINVAIPSLTGLLLIWFANTRNALGARFRKRG